MLGATLGIRPKHQVVGEFGVGKRPVTRSPTYQLVVAFRYAAASTVLAFESSRDQEAWQIFCFCTGGHGHPVSAGFYHPIHYNDIGIARVFILRTHTERLVVIAIRGRPPVSSGSIERKTRGTIKVSTDYPFRFKTQRSIT